MVRSYRSGDADTFQMLFCDVPVQHTVSASLRTAVATTRAVIQRAKAADIMVLSAAVDAVFVSLLPALLLIMWLSLAANIVIFGG